MMATERLWGELVFDLRAASSVRRAQFAVEGLPE